MPGHEKESQAQKKACFEIDYLPEVVENDIPTLPKSARSIIKKAIEERLSLDPIRFGKPLRYSLKGDRRLRVSDYRIVYRIDSKAMLVTIVAIKHSKDIYED